MDDTGWFLSAHNLLQDAVSMTHSVSNAGTTHDIIACNSEAHVLLRNFVCWHVSSKQSVAKQQPGLPTLQGVLAAMLDIDSGFQDGTH